MDVDQPSSARIEPKPRPKRRGVLAAEARRAVVAQGLMARLSYREIVELLSKQNPPMKCSLETVSQDAKKLTAMWRESQLANVMEIKATEIAALDKAISVLWVRVLQGNVAAVDRYEKLLAMKVRLMGLAEPEKKMIGGWEGAAPIPMHHEVVEEQRYNFDDLPEETMQFLESIAAQMEATDDESP